MGDMYALNTLRTLERVELTLNKMNQTLEKIASNMPAPTNEDTSTNEKVGSVEHVELLKNPDKVVKSIFKCVKPSWIETTPHVDRYCTEFKTTFKIYKRRQLVLGSNPFVGIDLDKMLTLYPTLETVMEITFYDEKDRLMYEYLDDIGVDAMTQKFRGADIIIAWADFACSMPGYHRVDLFRLNNDVATLVKDTLKRATVNKV